MRPGPTLTRTAYSPPGLCPTRSTGSHGGIPDDPAFPLFHAGALTVEAFTDASGHRHRARCAGLWRPFASAAGPVFGARVIRSPIVDQEVSFRPSATMTDENGRYLLRVQPNRGIRRWSAEGRAGSVNDPILRQVISVIDDDGRHSGGLRLPHKTSTGVVFAEANCRGRDRTASSSGRHGCPTSIAEDLWIGYEDIDASFVALKRHSQSRTGVFSCFGSSPGALHD